MFSGNVCTVLCHVLVEGMPVKIEGFIIATKAPLDNESLTQELAQY